MSSSACFLVFGCVLCVCVWCGVCGLGGFWCCGMVFVVCLVCECLGDGDGLVGFAVMCWVTLRGSDCDWCWFG